MPEILDNTYAWVYLVNGESVLLLAFIKYMIYSHCTQSCISFFSFFCAFWKLKTLVWCDEKLFKIFLYLCIYFVQKTAQF